MARDDWRSRSPRRGERRWGERRPDRERARGLEDLERGYGATYEAEDWETAEPGWPGRGRPARERWAEDWWGTRPRGGYGGYEEGYGAERMTRRRRGEGWERATRMGGRRYRGGEEDYETAYGSPYYDRLPYRSRRRGETEGEMGYGWPTERRMFRPYDREFQGGYGESYRGRPGGYTGEYGWGGQPGYRPWRRGIGRGGAARRWRPGRPYDQEYGW